MNLDDEFSAAVHWPMYMLCAYRDYVTFLETGAARPRCGGICSRLCQLP